MTNFLSQLLWEMRKMFLRPRTYVGFATFIIFEAVFLLLVRLPSTQFKLSEAITRAGFRPEDYISGLTIAFIITSATLLLMGALYLALVGGDIVSKEVEEGTMRMILCRPISRERILVLKVICLFIYTVVLVYFINLVALVTGFLYKGVGGLFIYVPPPETLFVLYGWAEGLQRYLASGIFAALSLFTISALAFFFSCINIKPAVATTLTISTLIADNILRHIPFFESIRPYFLTSYMSGWTRIFETRVPWERLLENYAVLFSIDATLLVLGWYVFRNRNFK